MSEVCCYYIRIKNCCKPHRMGVFIAQLQLTVPPLLQFSYWICLLSEVPCCWSFGLTSTRTQICWTCKAFALFIFFFVSLVMYFVFRKHFVLKLRIRSALSPSYIKFDLSGNVEQSCTRVNDLSLQGKYFFITLNARLLPYSTNAVTVK